MDVKSILILTILFFLMINCINAADNGTDNLTSDDVITEDINVTFDEQMWKENLSDINVELPENASGEFSVKIDDEIIYNQTITEKTFKVPVKLPTRGHEFVISIWPPIDCRYYKINAYYNNIDLNINGTLRVMNNPPDFNYMNFPKEILYHDEYSPMIAFPRSANGMVEYYIDDKLVNRTQVRPVVSWQKNIFHDLTLGNHTFRVIYYGDSYYKAYDRTFNFNVTQVVIEIPETVNISHDDCISVKTLKGTTGTVKVYIDNKLIHSVNTDDNYYVLSLEEYLKANSREVKVVYSNKDFTRTKTLLINITYDFDIYADSLTYGEKNIIEICLPDTLNNKLLKISINGTDYNFRHSDVENNIVEVDISKLNAGSYSMFVSYPGDARFQSHSKTYNFTIKYEIIYPWDIEFKDSSKIYLKLPNDATGNLEVCIDNKLFKSEKLSKGYAEIRIDSLKPGFHDVDVRYTGSDYTVDSISTSIYAEPKITLTYRFTAGENTYIKFEVPKDCKGYVIFNIDDRQYRANIKNGVAQYSFKNLKPGMYDVYVEYYGEDGVEHTSNCYEINVYKPKIKVISAVATFKDVNVKIKVLNKNGKAMANKIVVIKVNGKTFKVNTNKKGIAVLKKSIKIKSKKTRLKISYMGTKVSKKVKVKSISLKITKTSKRLILKSSIKKSVKNKLVTFKVAGKSFKIKTNSRGIAKLSIKKPKKTVKIQATYLKDTVTMKSND